MSLLDQFESLREVDKSGMGEILKEFPQRVEAAFAQELPDFNFKPKDVQSIVIVGLGGSAIGGDLAAAALADRTPKPIEVIRSATVPAWAGTHTLVIAVSYSGNTAEVLTAYEEARRRGCALVAVANGGTLAAHAQRDSVPFVQVSEYPQPRLAVGDLTAAVMKVTAQACGFTLEGVGEAIVGTLNELQLKLIPSVPTEENPAKLLAYKMLDRLPVVVGGGVMAPVARRWKTQVNENAKSMCIAESMPELLHNTIEGLKNPLRFSDDSVWVLLEAPDDPAVPQAQLDNLASLLEKTGIRVERVQAPLEPRTLTGQVPSGHLIASQWRLLYLGDWVSYYLACLQGVDPMPVPTIQSFKSQTPISKSQ